MKTLTVSICIIFTAVSLSTRGQSLSPEIISTAGESESSADIALSWTIGEVVTTTYSADDLILTQGFHQSEVVVVPIGEQTIEGLSLDVYPNPASQRLMIERQGSDKETMLLEIYNMEGVKVLTEKLMKGDKRKILNINDLPSATYILRMTQDNKFRSFKIIKQ